MYENMRTGPHHVKDFRNYEKSLMEYFQNFLYLQDIKNNKTNYFQTLKGWCDLWNSRYFNEKLHFVGSLIFDLSSNFDNASKTNYYDGFKTVSRRLLKQSMIGQNSKDKLL